MAGHPALAFLNSVEDAGKVREEGALADRQSFVRWLASVEGERHGAMWGLDPRTFDALVPADLSGLIALREVGYRCFSRLAADQSPSKDDQQALQAAVQTAIGRARLDYGGLETGCRDSVPMWRPTADPNHALEDRIALSFEDLLRSPDLHRLKECGRCSWLFLDHGRGRGRKWCDMRRCGNREKSAKFRQRHTE